MTAFTTRAASINVDGVFGIGVAGTHKENIAQARKKVFMFFLSSGQIPKAGNVFIATRVSDDVKRACICPAGISVPFLAGISNFDKAVTKIFVGVAGYTASGGYWPLASFIFSKTHSAGHVGVN